MLELQACERCSTDGMFVTLKRNSDNLPRDGARCEASGVRIFYVTFCHVTVLCACFLLQAVDYVFAVACC